jgi:hypothetical protein
MGASQRTKGHSFERDIARRLRARWPHLTVRRSQQGDKAYEPDVVIENVPLWVECCVGAKPNPLVKLAQAERDVERFTAVMCPVVVWRRSGERTTWATMRPTTMLMTWGGIFDEVLYQSEAPNLVLTVDFDEWLQCVDLPETRARGAA